MKLDLSLSLGGARGGGALGSHDLTIGNDAGGRGFDGEAEPPYGSVKPTTYMGKTIVRCDVNTTDIFVLRFEGPDRQIPDVTIVNVSFPSWNGGIPIKCTWSAANTRYEATGADRPIGLYAAWGSELGNTIPFTPTALVNPTNIDLSNTSVPENAAVDTVVGIISSNGVPSSATYSLTSNPGGYFKIAGNELQVAIALPSGPTTVDITIQADNGAGSPFSQPFTINVTEVIVAPTTLNLDNSTVPETATVGTLIGTFTSNGNGTKTYTKIADPDNKFTITSGGELRLANTVTFPATHSVTCRVSNSAGSYSEAFNITVTEASADDDMFSALVIGAAEPKNGWMGTATALNVVAGGTYAGLKGTGMVLTSQDAGFDDTGSPITVNRTIRATAVLRKPYNQGTVLEENASGSNLETQFSFEDQVFTGRTISAQMAAAFYTNTGGASEQNSGGNIATVTNSSTQAYSPVQACWLTPPLEQILSDTWAPRLFAFNRFGQDGRPVRAVKFIATGQTSSNTVESTVTTVSTGQQAGTGLYTCWYQPVWDLSGMTEGETVVINAIIYPWIGEALDLSTLTEAHPSPNLKTLTAIYDSRRVYVHVAASAGSTPQASTDPAIAALPTNHFGPDMGLALTTATTGAIAVNNANYSRNSTSGVVVRIEPSTVLSGTGTGFGAATAGTIPILIEGVAKATSVLADTGANAFGSMPKQWKAKDLTIRKTANIVALDNGVDSNNQAVMENVAWESTGGTGLHATWLYRIGRGYFIDCTGTYWGQGSIGSTQVQGTALALGSNVFGQNACYNAFASRNPAGRFIALTNSPLAQLGDPEGNCYFFNEFSNNVAGDPIFALNGLDFGARGFAVGGNIFEKFGSSGAGANTDLYSSNTDIDLQYGWEGMNTIVGDRSFVYYAKGTTPDRRRNGFSWGSIHPEINLKSDYFGNNGALLGNYATRSGVGGGYRLIISGDSNGITTPRYDAWLGEALGNAKNEMPTGDVTPGNPDFVNDQSGTGGTGGGDYRLGASTASPQIPGNQIKWPRTLYNEVIPVDGTARAGARQLA